MSGTFFGPVIHHVDTVTDYHFTDGTGKTTDFDYDQAGLLESTVYPDGSTTIDRTNDWRGRIDTLKRSATTLADYAYIGPRVAQRSYGVPSVEVATHDEACP